MLFKMKILEVCFLFAVWVSADRQKRVSSKYEYVDLDALLSNNRTLNNYINCILEKGPCTPEGRDLRENIPRALRSACSECNDSQKYFIRKATLYVMKNRPHDWQDIIKKYNPKGEYRELFYKFLAEG